MKKITLALTLFLLANIQVWASNENSDFTCNQIYTGIDTWYGDDHYKKPQQADQYAIPLKLQYRTAGIDGKFSDGDGALVTFFCTEQNIDDTCDIEPYFLKNIETLNDKYWNLRSTLKSLAAKKKFTGFDIRSSSEDPVKKINSNFSIPDADWVIPCAWEFKRKVDVAKKQYTELINKNYSDHVLSGAANSSGKSDSIIEERKTKLAELETLLPTNADECNNKKFTFENSVGEIWGTDIFNDDISNFSAAASYVSPVVAGVSYLVEDNNYTGYPDHWAESDGSGGREAEKNKFPYDETSNSGDIDDKNVKGILSSMSALHTTCVMPPVSSPNVVFGVGASGSAFTTFAKLDVTQAEYSTDPKDIKNKAKLNAEKAKDDPNYAAVSAQAATASGSMPGASGGKSATGPQAQGPQKAGNRLPGSTGSSNAAAPSSGLGGLSTGSTGPLAEPSASAAGAGGTTDSSGTYRAGSGGGFGGGGYARGDGSFGGGGDGAAPSTEMSFDKENTGKEVNPMGSEDVEDYFTRINIDENIFKRIHDKYHRQAVAWEGGALDENRKPAATTVTPAPSSVGAAPTAVAPPVATPPVAAPVAP